MYCSEGYLRYRIGPEGGYSLRLEVEQDILEYYRWLLPPYVQTNKPMYPAHISVVRKEVPPNLTAWGNHEGEEVDFVYYNVIFTSETYLWLNVYSRRLEEIRRELGLEVSSRYRQPPEGFSQTFHMTIGNFKLVRIRTEK